MSYTTSAKYRQAIDDLDDIFRAAANNGTIEEIFVKKRKALVSGLIIIN